MDKKNFSRPISLNEIEVVDSFWKNEMELVRTEVIPYQWKALNDEIPDAAKSYCMHNFRAAAALASKERNEGSEYVPPAYTFRGFEALPEDVENPDPDKFFGFVFQDTDFSKWIEAVGYSLTQHPDPELERIADGAIDVVCAAQAKDGYLDTYYIINGRDKTFTNLKDHHELYCLGHLIEGAVAYYNATGKRKLLDAAARFADYVYDYFGSEKDKCKGYPGHEIAEMALVRLYEATGEEKYLELARFFVDERGKRPYYFDTEVDNSKLKEDELRYQYHQAHLPVREQEEAVGHAVRAVYLYSGMADVARLTGDEALLEACRKLYRNIVDKKMYITGGIGATHLGEAFSFEYDLPNDTAYSETCASIGMMFFMRRLLEIEARGEYADVMERELYNVVLSGMALDGKSFFYVNPLESNPVACHKDERKFHVKPVRQKWFGCACCPPNIARTLSSLGSYCFTKNEDTIFIHLYVGANIKTEIGGQGVELSITSDMPNSGRVTIKTTGPKNYRLALRIPGWCYGKYELKGAKVLESKDGYLYVNVNEAAEEITLTFDMPVKLMKSSNRVRENIGKAALMRGPVVYCLEEADNGPELQLLKIEKKTKFIEEKAILEGVNFVRILADGYRLEESEVHEDLYFCQEDNKEKPVKLTYIPYYMWANRGENEMQVWTTTN